MNFANMQRLAAFSKSTSLLLSRPGALSLVPFTSFQTSAALCSEAKTPIQKFGAEYLERQQKTNRPVSPHLTIYAPQLTWYVSGAHRIVGCVMGGAVVVFMGGMLLMPFDFSQLIEFIRHLGLPSVITASLKFIIAFPLIFHFLNGIRFLGFDMGLLMDIKNVYKTGWTVVGLAVILALLLTVWRKADKIETTKKA